jgi:hypothetical protein
MGTALTTVIMILGLVLAITGLIGSILPMLPGPPLSYMALIVLSFAKDWEPFSATFLITMGALTVLVLVLDYVVPAVTAKKFGASKLGVWGAAIGLLIGFFVFPPFGLFIGGFAGAVVGELIMGREGGRALHAGWGVFVGNVVNAGLKICLSAIMLFFYVKEMF